MSSDTIINSETVHSLSLSLKKGKNRLQYNVKKLLGSAELLDLDTEFRLYAS